MLKKILIILGCFLLFSGLYSISDSGEINVAHAKEDKAKEDKEDKEDKAKEDKKKAMDTTGFSEKLDKKFLKKFKSLNDIIMSLGIVLCVIFLVVGGITLASSMGNPQKRSIGISAIICACIGAYVVYKSRMIAGWMIGI